MGKTLRTESVPGAIIKIQTAGNLCHTNVHGHVISSDGIFMPNATFRYMPRYSDTAKLYLKRLFEQKVAKYCVEKGFAREETMRKRLSWRHTGFSVYFEQQVVYTLHNDDKKERLEKLLRYIAKPHYAQDRVIYKENAKTVLYRSEYNHSIKQNFRTFTPTEFIAALTVTFPTTGRRH